MPNPPLLISLHRFQKLTQCLPPQDPVNQEVYIFDSLYTDDDVNPPQDPVNQESHMVSPEGAEGPSEKDASLDFSTQECSTAV